METEEGGDNTLPSTTFKIYIIVWKQRLKKLKKN